ncbi:MAG TPA: NADH-quinone oxidoreductase subunit L [Euryarchaeota archaeon]|nr:NADH-quinone oxidoreductase subunit L [Euryarchaeota archaeon]
MFNGFEMLILALPLFGAALLPLVGFLGESAKKWFAVLISAITAGFVFYMIPKVWSGSPVGGNYGWIHQFGIDFTTYVDPIAAVMAAIAAGIGALVIVYSTKYMEGQGGLSRYYVLVLIFIAAMIGLVFTDSLLVLYIFWEIVGLCSYSLIGFYHKDKKAAKAGMKAFIVTRIGDVGLFFAVMALYLHTGTFSIQELIVLVKDPAFDWVIATDFGNINVLTLAAFGVLVGAAGKSAQVPLHTWLPDAMEAPTTISALIHAATMVNSGVYLVARTMPLFEGVNGWLTTVLWLGGITALLAASLAIVEPDLKRVLAYSTVSQLGYMFFALGFGTAGVAVAMFHLLNHAIFKALLFLGAGSVIHAVGTRNMYEMGGLKNTMKITMITMGLGALALSGIPPLSGFFSKDLIFHEAMHHSNYIALAVVAIAAVLTLVYTFKMFWLVFVGKPRANQAGHESPLPMTIPLIILAIGAVASWALFDYMTYGFNLYNLGTHHTLGEFVKETFTSAPFFVSLIVLALGGVVFFFRWNLGNILKDNLTPVYNFMRMGYGFDIAYNKFVKLLRHGAWGSKRLQTGDANYNAIGIVIALVILLAVFWFYGGVL